MMRQPEKPCPFCGDIDHVFVSEGYGIWVCGCDNQNCQVEVCAYGYTRDEAIDNWERRSE